MEWKSKICTLPVSGEKREENGSECRGAYVGYLLIIKNYYVTKHMYKCICSET